MYREFGRMSGISRGFCLHVSGDGDGDDGDDDNDDRVGARRGKRERGKGEKAGHI